jgi:sugar lactone lactonase YvrE
MLGVMTDRSLEVLVGTGTFYEGPRWHEGRWWVSDFYRQTVFAITPDGVAVAELTVDQQPSGLGWLQDGTMLIISMKDRRLLRRTTAGAVEEVADLSGLATGNLNDMVVDQEGRAWIGNFGFDLMGGGPPSPANLIRVDPDGTAVVVAEDMSFPNGSVVTPDGRTLIVGESLASRYTAFTIGEDGSLTDRRVWAQMSDPAVAPDGCCLDAEGHIWAADAFGNRCVRVAEGGAILEEIRTPDGLGVYACMLGGEDGRTLLMCCAPGFQEAERASAHDARLLTVEVEVPHAGCP